MSLKQKAISGILWSSVETFTSSGMQLIFGIFLARILSPKDFGLIGMLTIFMAVSQTFIDSGFTNALIRKKDCTESDLSTVFIFNLAIGAILYGILFISASTIAVFFKEPALKGLLQVLALGLIIESLTIIQRTILTKRVDFKLQTRISVIATIISGSLGVLLAIKGFGVWSLVFMSLARQVINSILLWIWNNWKPVLVFNLEAFRELFTFGSKLLASGLLDTIYRNVYFLVIGKYFSAQELGYYTRADQFKTYPSQGITTIVSRVTYPVLSQMQDDQILLKEGYKKMIKNIMLITFVLMLGMAAIAEPMTVALVGEKWKPSVIYLQMLCFVGMLYPLHALNLNMLNVMGRSDLFLRLEVIKKLLAIPTILIGILFGIKIMIVGMFINSIISYYLNSYWSGKLINYSISEQIKDITPSFILGSVVALAVYLLGYVIHFNCYIQLIIQIILGAILTIGIGESLKMTDYLFLRQVIFEKLRSLLFHK